MIKGSPVLASRGEPQAPVLRSGFFQVGPLVRYGQDLARSECRFNRLAIPAMSSRGSTGLERCI
jgi:hypothetical protein